MNRYVIRLRGQVDAAELSAGGPHPLTPVQAGPDTTALMICTDQSGLIGMLRHLHHLGLVLLAIDTLADTLPDDPERTTT